MRFDDSLDTVLSAEMSSPFGAQSTWRQLVDLIGRGRAPATPAVLQRLRAIRADVPPPVRTASARALATARPTAPLVALFADDEIGVAAPVLRTAMLTPAEWTAILPDMSPAARSILRHRRDLHPDVTRALRSFGSVDFVLTATATVADGEGHAPPANVAEPAGVGDVEPDRIEAAPPVAVTAAAGIDPSIVDTAEPLAEPVPDIARPTDLPAAASSAEPPAVDASPPATSFVSIASVAMALPVVAEALRRAEEAPDRAEADRVVATPDNQPAATGTIEHEKPEPLPAGVVALYPPPPPPLPEAAGGTFQIAELVARIDAYQRQRLEDPAPRIPDENQPELFALEPAQAESFRFETDAGGVVRWIEGAARAPLIGLSLNLAPAPGGSRVDGVAAGAFRRRAGFANARLVVDGMSDAAGEWRITGIPVFDRASGRFSGYRGTARRPRPDESAAPVRTGRDPTTDALRQLVHELRTPTNAISGFAEMIETQMLGPVPAAYRAHAAAIRGQASDLLTAIDDIDMAARIESQALDLRAGDVPLAPLLARIVGDLAPLAALRGCLVDTHVGDDRLTIAGDDRAIERLIARLMATLVASGGLNERIGVSATLENGAVALIFDRPSALAAYSQDGLLTIDAEEEAERDGAPLLGTGFALRLARNLATELRGSLTIGDEALTLRLPAAVTAGMEQVSSS